MSRLLNRRRRDLLSVVVLAVVMTASVAAQQRPDRQTVLNDAFNQFSTLKEGKNADYIPALAKVDPNLFGIALVTVDGKVFTTIGALMLAYGYIRTNWQQAVDLYTRQCSIGVNASDLATMAAMLAAGGKNPVTGKQV